MMKLEKNEELRGRGWSQFRSSSRDHLIPLTSAGQKLARVQIREAMPVNGVGVGQESIDLGARSQINDDRQRTAQKVFEMARDNPTGETIVCSYETTNQVANPGPAGNIVDEVNLVGTSPFSGFITEVTWREDNGGAVASQFALRTGSGGSVFGQGTRVITATTTIRDQSDFANVGTNRADYTSRRCRVPVLAGEQIFVGVRTDSLCGAFNLRLQITVTFESAEGAPLGARALVAAIAANRSAVAEGTRQVYLASQALKIEEEKTKRAVEVERLRVEQAKALGEQKRGTSTALQNPFSQTQLDALAKALNASRQRVAPAVPKAPPAKPAQPEGAGKTFVSAWNPSFGYIGYLIPNPPVGGKVNVFDNKYSVFDITGKLVEQGPIEPISSDSQIPAGARISRSLGTKLSAGIDTSTFVPGVGFV